MWRFSQFGKYPPCLTFFQNHCAARISESLTEKPRSDGGTNLKVSLDLSGTLCVEMFATADDIIVNEIAPPTQFRSLSEASVTFHSLTYILGVLENYSAFTFMP